MTPSRRRVSPLFERAAELKLEAGALILGDQRQPLAHLGRHRGGRRDQGTDPIGRVSHQPQIGTDAELAGIIDVGGQLTFIAAQFDGVRAKRQGLAQHLVMQLGVVPAKGALHFAAPRAATAGTGQIEANEARHRLR